MTPPRRGGRFAQLGQRGGDVYEGIEPPQNAAMSSLTGGGYGALKARSDATYDAEGSRLSNDRFDHPLADGGFGSALALRNNAASKISPWAPYFQALDDHGVDRMQGGESPDGSNQLRGFGNDQAVNRGGFRQAPVSAWHDYAAANAQPMPESQNSFESRLYGPAMKSLKRGR